MKTDARFGRQGGRLQPYDGDLFDPSRARRCEVCDEPMLFSWRKTHYGCEPASIVGKPCVCPPGCTDQIVGDAGTCKPECVPCRIMAGKRYNAIAEWQGSK